MPCVLLSFQDEVEECSGLSLDVSPALFVRNQREYYNIHIAPTSKLFLSHSDIFGTGVLGSVMALVN